MSNSKTSLAVICVLLLSAASLLAQESRPRPKLNIVNGPARAQLGTVAQMEIPTGYRFLDGDSTRALMKAEGEPTSGRELGLLMPTNGHWSVVFEFSDIGYVKDDDKDKLNADKLLASIKAGTAEGNKQRVRAGSSPIEIIGWEVPPKYDETSHNLEWAIRAMTDDKPLLNYNTRLLGRKGVMEVVLVVDPDQLQTTLPTFRNLLSSYSFQTGQSYAEFRSGDRIAKLGLGALIVGGAGLGAAKLGLFAWLAVVFKKAWKLVVIAIAALIAAIKKLFARLTGRPAESREET